MSPASIRKKPSIRPPGSIRVDARLVFAWAVDLIGRLSTVTRAIKAVCMADLQNDANANIYGSSIQQRHTLGYVHRLREPFLSTWRNHLGTGAAITQSGTDRSGRSNRVPASGRGRAWHPFPRLREKKNAHGVSECRIAAAAEAETSSSSFSSSSLGTSSPAQHGVCLARCLAGVSSLHIGNPWVSPGQPPTGPQARTPRTPEHTPHCVSRLSSFFTTST